MDIRSFIGRKFSFVTKVHNIHSPARWKRAAHDAFSLIEVTLAIGVMAFALLAIFGLIPVGLGTFRNAKDTSITSQIEEKIFSEVKSMTFDNLTNSSRYQPASLGTVTNFRSAFLLRTGTETSAADAIHIYHVNIRVVPGDNSIGEVGRHQTCSNVDLASVTIQVAYDPSNQKLALNGTTGLWTGATISSYLHWRSAYQLTAHLSLEAYDCASLLE